MNAISQNQTSHLFAKRFFTTTVISLFSIYIHSFNYQTVSKTLWYTNKTHHILFIRYTPRIYLHHMLFFHIETMILNDLN